MPQVWSRRLFTGRVNLAVAGTSNLVTCPAGSVILIYQICLFNPTGGTLTDSRFRIVPSGGPAVAAIAVSPATLQSVSLEQRLVLEEGDALQIRATTAGDYDLNVFGQELTAA